MSKERFEVFKQFRFEAAHKLPNLPEGHKCGRLHGHSYMVEVHVTGPLHSKFGWVKDYADISTCWKKIHDLVDHYYLNDLPGLENSTSEILAKWIWGRLSGPIRKLTPGMGCQSRLVKIVVHETCTAGSTYWGEASK